MKSVLLTPIVLCVVPFVATHLALAQGSAGSDATLEPRYLVDMPTAGMLEKGDFALDLDFYQEGGLLFGFSVGILDRISLGLSYGGTNLIGTGDPVMNSVPGASIRVRAIEEGLVFPAIVLGFDSQGRDGYIKELSRYTIKSPGLFAVASKNYSLLGFLSIHGGVNYSFERADEDRDFNVFVGADKSLGGFLSLVLEYNLGANDSNGRALGKGRGYLNTAIKCSIGGGLTLGVCLKDLTKNGNSDIIAANRTVKIEYEKLL